MIYPVRHVLAWSVGTMSDVSLFEVGLIAGGGAIGAASRYLIGAALARLTTWPGWAGVLLANLLGCLMIGIAVGSGGAGPWTHAFLMTGLCGALTTMSALALDLTVLLWIAAWRQFAWCLGLTLAIGIPLVRLGQAIGETLWGGVA
ncbi:MAG: fluoride efflux transporter CrcB [Phycisphaerae bacterium]|nr:fluoride efflux transporter CrcB [Phycisphaerae bacterium]MBT5383049.1 fluoride efflux transporter CrcB [Phycisphaerae bacterium]MBT5657149.1 fluoride efflux transporter CrcB [Phycisphaerae bacterium]